MTFGGEYKNLSTRTCFVFTEACWGEYSTGRGGLILIFTSKWSWWHFYYMFGFDLNRNIAKMKENHEPRSPFSLFTSCSANHRLGFRSHNRKHMIWTNQWPPFSCPSKCKQRNWRWIPVIFTPKILYPEFLAVAGRYEFLLIQCKPIRAENLRQTYVKKQYSWEHCKMMNGSNRWFSRIIFQRLLGLKLIFSLPEFTRKVQTVTFSVTSHLRYQVCAAREANLSAMEEILLVFLLRSPPNDIHINYFIQMVNISEEGNYGLDAW